MWLINVIKGFTFLPLSSKKLILYTGKLKNLASVKMETNGQLI